MPTHKVCVLEQRNLNLISPGMWKCCCSFGQVVASQGFLCALEKNGKISVLLLQSTRPVSSAGADNSGRLEMLSDTHTEFYALLVLLVLNLITGFKSNSWC